MSSIEWKVESLKNDIKEMKQWRKVAWCVIVFFLSLGLIVAPPAFIVAGVCLIVDAIGYAVKQIKEEQLKKLCKEYEANNG